jgi:hypothetical protein
MPRRRPSKKTLKEDPIGDTTEDPEKVSSKGEEKPPFRKRFKEYVMSHKTKFIIALLILLLAMGGILLWYLLDEDVSASAVVNRIPRSVVQSVVNRQSHVPFAVFILFLFSPLLFLLITDCSSIDTGDTNTVLVLHHVFPIWAWYNQ